MSQWTIDQARETYSLPFWSGGYFDINDAGHIMARPDPDRPEAEIDLYELTREFSDAGLALPVLVRFADILHHRVRTLCGAFNQAMEEHEYDARYTAVYPIKVNQQRTVVEEILGRNDKCVGLEAGSKPELMAVLALSNHTGSVVVCNGYKDREYIRLALIGRQLGHRVYIVIEKLSELNIVIREARDLGIQPLLGMRVRLASLGAGKWQNTGGAKSKFGLSASQVLTMVERLNEAGMIDSLQLMHFHMGSQISNISDIQKGMREASRFYAELHRLGVNIRCVDVGGGLGVDYEGTRSRSFCSINYSVQEYANNVVHALWDICQENELPYPDIFSESGRAMTAHHAVLITNVQDVERAGDRQQPEEPGEDAPAVLQDMWQVYEQMDRRSVLESYHDAAHWLTQVREMCTHGVLTLEDRAQAEQLYYATSLKALSYLQPSVRSHRELLDELNETMADKYFCNFSLFQSLPDIWAIKQIFPIAPLHRLNEEPDRRAVLQDLTCDSDGRVDLYVDREGVESTLPVHSANNKDYLLGMFMVGAYQEILGDMHNLFGDTDSVNVELQQNGDYILTKAEQGDTVEDVLRYVHFDAEELLQRYREKVARCELAEDIQQTMLEELEAGLRGYTYLED